MKFCQNCGLENAEEAATCTGCSAALAGSTKSQKRRPTAPMGEQPRAEEAGLLFDPASWRAKSKRPLRSAPGTRRHFLVPPIGEPIALAAKDGALVLGRDDECDIVIGSPKVSRRHVEISFKEGGFFVRDLGTMNGTRVNEHAVVESRPLADGDVLRFGDVMATYKVVEPGESSTKLRPTTSSKNANDTVPITRGTLGGNLALFAIEEVLAQLAKAKADGVLTIEGDEDGSVTFTAGAASNVKLGAKKGPAALQALQKLKKGIFKFEPRFDPR